MYQYDFLLPASVKEACEYLAQYGKKAACIAGGTDIMVQIHEGSKRWAGLEYIIDISHLESELKYIREDEKNLYIGALCTHTELERSELIQKYLPCLGKASSLVGSPQVRNAGTIGGAVCNALPASDPLPALVMADAVAEIVGVDGERQVKLVDLYLDKGALALSEGEMVKGFIVEKLPENTMMGFVKLGRRKALAISRLNASVAMALDADGNINFARVAPGCIFKVPARVESAEAMMIGKKPSLELFQAVGEEVGEEMVRRTGYRWSTEYKKPAVQAIVCDALAEAAGLEQV